VATLSHHIKNILQALGAGIELVGMGLNQGDPDKAKQSWPVVQRNLARINEMILNMLAFSKERQPLLESIDLNEVLTDCVELIVGQADERGVAVLTDFADMPSIAADAAGLRQVVLNLLNNALDAVGDGTGALTVSSRYDAMDRNVVIQIIDNGGGIDPEEMDRIFTPFYSSKGHKGTGLGLTVARKVCQEHRGKIEVQSKLNEGTTFTLTFPAMPDAGTSPGDTFVSRQK